MTIANSIGMPVDSLGIGLYRNSFLSNQDFQYNMFRGFNHEWEMDNMSNTMLPSTSRVMNPISVIGQPMSSVEQVVQTNVNKTEIENELSNSQPWFSELDEMKNLERKKVNTFLPKENIYLYN